MTAVRLVQIVPSPPDGEQTVGDIGRALAAILSSDAPLTNALGLGLPMPPIEASQFVKQTDEWCKSHDAASFAITVNQCEAVGQLSISRLGDKERQGRIGYWLASNHWGKRIMSEAFAQALVEAKSYGLKTVCGHVPLARIASEKLWIRHGAKRTASGNGMDVTIAL